MTFARDPSHFSFRRLVGATVVIATFILQGSAWADSDESKSADDVLSIVQQNCGACHKPGGLSPFSLLTHEDISKRAKQIGIVVANGYMPPWLPEPNPPESQLLGERRLKPQQIELLSKWIEGGAKPQSTTAETVAVEDLHDSWPLGAPDLVLTLDQPYTLPAEGSDVVRTFVFPLQLPEDEFVRAIDFRPGNPRVVHHASFSVDDTGNARMIDAGDPQPGYASMGDLGLNLSGSWGVWSPAPDAFKSAQAILPANVARPLPNPSDFVVEVHFNLTGKPETIQPQVALYFTNEPVRKAPVAMTLGTSFIDIAPGERGYTVRDELELPIDVQLLSLAPRAHYVCTKMSVTATFADGRALQLLRIDDWDFNWTQEYSYASPICLPAGTKIQMEYVYDNSDQNRRNPSHPPKRVTAGYLPTDEMGLLFLYLIPNDRGGEELLERTHRARLLKRMNDAIAKRQRSAEPSTQSSGR